VLTIHEDYFLLTGGIERWLYRVARKHAGKQETGWSFSMRTALREVPDRRPRVSDFAIDIRRVVAGNQLPGVRGVDRPQRRRRRDRPVRPPEPVVHQHPRYEAPRSRAAGRPRTGSSPRRGTQLRCPRMSRAIRRTPPPIHHAGRAVPGWYMAPIATIVALTACGQRRAIGRTGIGRMGAGSRVRSGAVPRAIRRTRPEVLPRIKCLRPG